MKHLLATTLAAALIVTPALAHEVIHLGHDHEHEADCGHQAVAHDGHVDYLHDGHLHEPHGSHTDEHMISVSAANPSGESIVTVLTGHKDHDDQEDGHILIQHGDHFDHIHDGRLHRIHGSHVDDHGPIKVLKI